MSGGPNPRKNILSRLISPLVPAILLSLRKTLVKVLLSTYDQHIISAGKNVSIRAKAGASNLFNYCLSFEKISEKESHDINIAYLIM